MTEQGEDPSDLLDGEHALHDVTDEEWRAAHQALIDSGAIPPEEAEYIWQPGVAAEFFDPRPQMTYVTDDDDA